MIAILDYHSSRIEFSFQSDEDEFPFYLRFYDRNFFESKAVFRLDTVTGSNIAYYILCMEEVK